MMEPNTMRLVRSDGLTFDIDGTEWAIAKDGLVNWLNVPINLNTSPNVLTHGSSLVSKRVEETAREASFFHAAWTSEREARDKVESFFNPNYSFKAYLTVMGRTRWCEGELQAVKYDVKYERQITEVTFTLLCLDPYMRDVDGNESAFGDSVPMLGWPYVAYADEEGLEYPTGLVAGVLVFDGLNSIVNGGDVSTQYRIRVEAEGTLVNPTINKDGRFVRMLLTLYPGDVLEIDFESAPPKVTKNGQNVIHYASRDSAFTKMAMQPGKNVFSFTVDNEENRSLAKVQVLFHEKFLGV